MIETAIKVSDKTINNEVIERILEIGKEMLEKPVVVMEGVEDILESLKNDYRLVMATKGDLRDQEKKLEKSGLADYFHHTEVMSEKKNGDYQKLIQHLDINPSEFLMVGNSIKSDILPVVRLGGNAIHVPFHVTWEYEKAEVEIEKEGFYQIDSISEVPEIVEIIEKRHQ